MHHCQNYVKLRSHSGAAEYMKIRNYHNRTEAIFNTDAIRRQPVGLNPFPCVVRSGAMYFYKNYYAASLIKHYWEKYCIKDKDGEII